MRNVFDWTPHFWGLFHTRWVFQIWEIKTNWFGLRMHFEVWYRKNDE